METEKEQVFDHIPSPEEMKNAYEKMQEDNPASIFYERKNEKPKLYLFRTIIFVLIAISLSVGVAFLVEYLSKKLWLAILLGLVFLLLIFIVFLKRIVIWLIKLYQNLAPDYIRNRCRFEPSCSNYMLLAIEKYGLFKGLKKGINRLKRCKPPNSGYDYP